MASAAVLRTRILLSLIACGLIGFARTAEAGPVVAPKPSPRAERLAGRLRPLVERHQGDVAVAVVNLDTGESYFRNADEPMPTASLIKLAVLVEAYRQDRAGAVSLASPVTLRQEDKVPGSGILTTHFSPGTTIPLRDAVRLMIVYSDNTATNLVLDRVGLAAVNETMDSLGCPNTRVHAKVYRRETSIDLDRSRRFGLGSTTAREAVSLLARLHRGEAVDPAACEAMLADLRACDDRKKLPRFLPTNTKIAHKTGSVDAVRTDAGLIETPGGTVAVCVLTANNQDKSWTDENAAERLIAEVGKAVFEHFAGPANAALAGGPSGPLAEGANGGLVADLQRTLNERMTPSPALSVDGDFGPSTKSAVERFQREKGLEPTGLVGVETWAALGPLVPEKPVPDPDAIAQEALALAVEPADADPHAPPHVTCPAWAIGDAETGDILWDKDGDKPRPIASTTKVMTAFVVAEYAAAHPEAFDETVTISERADRTPGTSADSRAGERLPVRELLYGLLLPSGNDAATALAEHFGSRFDPPAAADLPKGGDPQDPLVRFVAEMNRAAARLGLSSTRFRNPHGLDAAGHEATPRDLVKLAATVMRHERLREVVSTRLHGCTVESAVGYRRNVRWGNTNKLLGVTGYGGLKTGTTGEAGACLVSFGECPTPVEQAGGDGETATPPRRLIVVVLGSTSTDARYVDTRNLFRWAWGRPEPATD